MLIKLINKDIKLIKARNIRVIVPREVDLSDIKSPLLSCEDC